MFVVPFAADLARLLVSQFVYQPWSEPLEHLQRKDLEILNDQPWPRKRVGEAYRRWCSIDCWLGVSLLNHAPKPGLSRSTYSKMREGFHAVVASDS